MFFETSDPKFIENCEKKTKTSQKSELSLKRLDVFNIVKISSILRVPVAQVPSLKNVSFSKFASEPPHTSVKNMYFRSH